VVFVKGTDAKQYPISVWNSRLLKSEAYTFKICQDFEIVEENFFRRRLCADFENHFVGDFVVIGFAISGAPEFFLTNL